MIKLPTLCPNRKKDDTSYTLNSPHSTPIPALNFLDGKFVYQGEKSKQY